MNDKKYKNYLLVLLLVILAFNFADRFVLGMLMQDIKQDLDLSDSELGFLSGIAFTLFYAFMGIPIARWADKGNRITIISVTVALWSVMVALCGAATSFLQLLLVRIGVAVGEAGCLPPANSLIADVFTRAERPRATAIFMLGIPLSTVIGYFLAGWVNEFYGWRATFIVVLALPGIVLAPLAWFTLREPRQQSIEDVLSVSPLESMKPALDQVPPVHASTKQTFLALWAIPTFRHLVFGYAVGYFFAYGLAHWMPAFFIRSHGMETGAIGTWFAVAYGGGGLIGTYLGGEIASRYAAKNESLQLRAIGIVFAISAFVYFSIYWFSNQNLAIALLGVTAVVGMTVNGPLLAVIQTLVPGPMRATAIAFLYFFANLIGLGLGPLGVGLLSDMFAPIYGEESLRYALLVFCPGYFWAATHFWLAGNTVKADMTIANEGNSEEAMQQANSN